MFLSISALFFKKSLKKCLLGVLDVIELSDNCMSLIMGCDNIFPRLSNVHSLVPLSTKMFPMAIHISLQKDSTFENPYWWYTMFLFYSCGL